MKDISFALQSIDQSLYLRMLILEQLSSQKLKKKYFKDEDIVFHSRDMYRKKGPFAILQDPKTELAFWTEFIGLAEDPEIGLIFIIVDKGKAKAKGWQPKTILKRAYLKILEEFANKQLKKRISGKIIVESDPSQAVSYTHLTLPTTPYV